MNATAVRPVNAQPSKRDVRDFKLATAAGPLPARYDLRQFVVSVEDQAQEGSCTAFALKNNLQMVSKAKGKYEKLSAQLQYWDVGSLEGTLAQEGRFSLRDGLEAARRYGICLESEWPYTADDEHVKPSDAAWASAATRKVLRYEAVDLAGANVPGGAAISAGVNNLKAAVASGRPVMFTLALGKDFYNLHGPLASQVGQYGPIVWPDAVGSNQYIGFHAMNIVGYDDALGGFIVLNQWAETFGDAGYCLLMYDRIVDFTEAWVVQAYKDIDLTDPVLAKAQTQIARLYVGVLGRVPDLAGFNWWVNTVVEGSSQALACTGFLASDERKAKFASAAEVICSALDDVPAFDNKVAVALYCVVDLACDRASVCQAALTGVTADSATVDAAKTNVRLLLGDGIL